MSSMKKHIAFPSIEQFRNITSHVHKNYNFMGIENGVPVYNELLEKPTITFTGTVKLHGTNAGVCYNSIDGLWAQSRENIITPIKDNAGFAFFVESKKDTFTQMVEKISKNSNINLEENTISVYGEWAGQGIQKGVAISNLEKSFFIFGVKITPHNESPTYWIDYKNVNVPDSKIYNIMDFKTYSIDIDFNRSDIAQNKLVDYTIDVEKECPVAKEFGFEGIGEGIVWTGEFKGQILRFKVKGELHSKSKVKTLNVKNTERVDKILEIAQKVTPEWRLEQMLQQACDLLNRGQIDRSKLGDFIRLVVSDVLKEELDIIAEAGFEPKDLNPKISDIARKYFFQQEKIRNE